MRIKLLLVLLFPFILWSQGWQSNDEKANTYLSEKKLDSAEYFANLTLKQLRDIGPIDTSAISPYNVLLYSSYYRGKYNDGVSYCRKILEIEEKTYGKNNLEYAASANNLAFFLEISGNVDQARPYYEVSKNIKGNILGKNHPDYASSCSNFGYHLYSLGDYDNALSNYQTALSIYKENPGENSHEYGRVCNNIGALFMDINTMDSSIFYYKKCHKIYTEVLDSNHNSLAACSNNLGYAYAITGEYEKALPLYTETMRIYKATLPDDHPDVAISLSNIGDLHYRMGNYDKAEEFFFQSKAINEEFLGKNHPYYARNCNNIMGLYYKKGDFEEGKPFSDHNLDVFRSTIWKNFAVLADEEREKYLQSMSHEFDSYYTFSVGYAKNEASITGQIFNTVIHNKGMLLKSSTAMRNSILNSKDNQLIQDYKAWIELQKSISNEYSKPIKNQADNLENLIDSATTIERELVKKSALFKSLKNNNDKTWKDIQKQLKENEVVIEYFRYNAGAFDDLDSVVYKALILTKKMETPKLVDLCSEKEIISIFNNLQGADFTKIKSLYGYNTQNNQSLYNYLWKPLQSCIPESSVVYYSPVGMLYRVSFAAISDGKALLATNYQLNQKSNTLSITNQSDFEVKPNMSATIVGGVNYNLSNENELEVWSYLPGTKKEGEIVQQLLQDYNLKVNYLTADNATEKAVLSNAKKSDILHISTHGFFYPDPTKISETYVEEYMDTIVFRGSIPSNQRGMGVEVLVKNENPLMRSGLTFSGANKIWNSQDYSGENDGVLTALEVANADLSSIKLVVLSACETGLGDIYGSEGVYGLQRAFKMAGAENIIMSLWQVPDEETQEFMSLFYSEVTKGKSLKLAFNSTQRKMSEVYEPYFWAAFVFVE